MRISPESRSAQVLTFHGVGRRQLEATRVFVWNFQLGSAITLPVPIVGPSIFIKRAWLDYDEDGELRDSAHIKMLCHEFCHIHQIQEWGSVKYVARHLLARIRTRSVLARSAPEEEECYSVQERVGRYYEDRSGP